MRRTGVGLGHGRSHLVSRSQEPRTAKPNTTSIVLILTSRNNRCCWRVGFAPRNPTTITGPLQPAAQDYNCAHDDSGLGHKTRPIRNPLPPAAWTWMNLRGSWKTRCASAGRKAYAKTASGPNSSISCALMVVESTSSSPLAPQPNANCWSAAACSTPPWPMPPSPNLNSCSGSSSTAWEPQSRPTSTAPPSILVSRIFASSNALYSANTASFISWGHPLNNRPNLLHASSPSRYFAHPDLKQTSTTQ
jgi:hypothetical protein